MLAAPRLWLDRNGSGETTWIDCVPGRTDLPRTLPDMPALGVTRLRETDAVPPGDGWCYRRAPRPGQGRLTSGPTVGLCVVLISPRHDTVDAATALRDWGDFVHISHIAAAGVPGYTMITPYEIEGAGGPRYLHLYEMDDDDPEARFQAMTPLVRDRLADAGAFEEWAWHSELRIDYVSTYRRRSPATQTGPGHSSTGAASLATHDGIQR
jgi:hypothetical protein